MEKYSSPVSIFSHSARIDIMNMLIENNHSVTELSDELQLSSSEISRHLSKLAEHGFVAKSATTRRYEITPYGRSSLDLFAPLQFIFSKNKYFQSHDFSKLPRYLQLEINHLKNAEFIEGTGLVMLKMQQLVENTQEEFWVMVDQPFPFGKEGLKTKFFVPIDFMKGVADVGDVYRKRGIEARVMDKLPVSMGIGDGKSGILYFPDMSGRLDYSFAFYSEDKDCVNYFIQIWEYFWQRAAIPDL